MANLKSITRTFLGWMSFVVALLPVFMDKPETTADELLRNYAFSSKLWFLCILLFFFIRTKKLRKYWWIWISGFILFEPYIEYALTFYCWDKTGFAP